MTDSLLSEAQKIKIISCIADKEHTKIISIIEPLKTPHAGTPKTKDKRFVIKEIVKRTNKSKNPEKEFFETGKFFCDRSEPVCKEIGIVIISQGFRYNKKAVTYYIEKISDDENWEVREYAAGAVSNVILKNIDFYGTMMKWTGHSSENVRRAVVLGSIGLRDTKSKVNVQKAFKLLYPLMYDDSMYVKKNLGPFVLGSHFGNHYPAETFSQLKKWARLKNENVRWNIAMSFNNSFGNKYPKPALEILVLLAGDERKTVRRAVISTLRSLNKRYPQLILPFIKRHNIKL